MRKDTINTVPNIARNLKNIRALDATQVSSVKSDRAAGFNVGVDKYNPILSDREVSFELVCEVLKLNSSDGVEGCPSGTVHWLNYFYSLCYGQDDFNQGEYGIYPKHMYALACLHADDLVPDAKLNLMKESAMVLAHILGSGVAS